MTELEFFVHYELRPSPACPGEGVEVWGRNSGLWGQIREATDRDGAPCFVVTVAPDVAATRKSFGAALRLMIKTLERLH